MGLLDRFRRKKEERTDLKPEEKSLTGLEEFLKGDQETYEALSNAMFLDPAKIDVSMSDAAEKARKAEKDKDLVKAKVWYEIAGGLAIYEGDIEKVKEYYSKCQKISPDTKYPILKNPEKAVKRAKEYYKNIHKPNS